MRPAHQPHEQLRTEAPSQKDHTDKYVSTFVSGSNTVDMSFSNPVLSKSADYFKVGIDELTLNLNNLSLLEFVEGEVLFRIIRRGYLQLDNTNPEQQAALTGYKLPDGPAANLGQWRDAVEFKVDRSYLTIMEVLSRCTQIATSLNTFVREGLVNGGAGGDLYIIPVAAGADYDAFEIALTTNGQLRFSGNKVFWANFVIEFPTEKYRQILFNDPDRQYIAMHPGSGATIDAPYILNGGLYEPAGMNPVWDGAVEPLAYVRAVEYVGKGNVLNMLDRRVTLEVGTSLPLKNSPMIDHNVEAPDFIIGRYMFHQPYTLIADQTGQGITLQIPGLGTRQMQGPKDRVCYHHLRPQQRIQNIRVRLWARVRTYDETTKTWGMKAIECPVEGGDFWHLKLHFVEKNKNTM